MPDPRSPHPLTPSSPLIADGWSELLISCGAPLAALSLFVHGALEYLEKAWNLHAWSLHRTRVYIYNLLAHTSPTLLTTLSAHARTHQHGAAANAGLRPGAVLSRVAKLVHASLSDGAAQAASRSK